MIVRKLLIIIILIIITLIDIRILIQIPVQFLNINNMVNKSLNSISKTYIKAATANMTLRLKISMFLHHLLELRIIVMLTIIIVVLLIVILLIIIIATSLIIIVVI